MSEDDDQKAELMAGGATVGSSEGFRRLMVIVWVLGFIVLALVFFT